jgi:hypothetical protein
MIQPNERLSVLPLVQDLAQIAAAYPPARRTFQRVPRTWKLLCEHAIRASAEPMLTPLADLRARHSGKGRNEERDIEKSRRYKPRELSPNCN